MNHWKSCTFVSKRKVQKAKGRRGPITIYSKKSRTYKPLGRRIPRAVTARSTGRYTTRLGRSIFPPVGNYVFDYAQSNTLSPAAGGVASQLFRGNSLFDPDATGVGSQPRYFDTLCGANNTTAPYNDYCVYAFNIDCFIRNTSDVHMFVSISAYLTTASSAPASLAEARERPDTIVRIVSPLGSGPATAKLSMYGNVTKIGGVKDLLDNPDFKAAYNANPAESISVIVQAWNPDGGAAKSVVIDSVLRYYSKLTQITDVADS